MRVVAEWNLTQEEVAAARRPRRRGQPPPPPPRGRGRPQSPRAALARLAHAPNTVAVAPDAAAFWFGQGLIHVG